MIKLGIGLLLFVSLTALAQQPKETDYQVVPKKQAIEEGSSAFHRINQKYELGAQLFGVGPGPIGTLGLYGAYRIDRNSLVLFEAMNGRAAYNISFLSSSTYDIQGRSFGLHYKKFAGNSFYWRAGIDYQAITYSHTYESTFLTTVNSKGDFKGYSVLGNFQIGNQWQWNNFTLGCDWVGYSASLTSHVSEESATASNATELEYEKQNLKSNQDTLLKKGSLTALRFYLGWAF